MPVTARTVQGWPPAPWPIFGKRCAMAADVPSTMIVGVHHLADETLRLHEYSPGFDPERFAAHEEFFVGDVRHWARSRFGVALPPDRTAVGSPTAAR